MVIYSTARKKARLSKWSGYKIHPRPSVFFKCLFLVEFDCPFVCNVSILTGWWIDSLRQKLILTSFGRFWEWDAVNRLSAICQVRQYSGLPSWILTTPTPSIWKGNYCVTLPSQVKPFRDLFFSPLYSWNTVRHIWWFLRIFSLFVQSCLWRFFKRAFQIRDSWSCGNLKNLTRPV